MRERGVNVRHRAGVKSLIARRTRGFICYGVVKVGKRQKTKMHMRLLTQSNDESSESVLLLLVVRNDVIPFVGRGAGNKRDNGFRVT